MSIFLSLEFKKLMVGDIRLAPAKQYFGLDFGTF
jgi:hypothetical protein